MPAEENKAIARRFLQAWRAGGQGIVEELAAPDITVSYSHFPQPFRGAQAFRELLAQTIGCFPDLQIADDEIIAEEDRVMVRWSWTGSHQHGEMFGVLLAGKRVHVTGIGVYRIAQGKVLEESGVVDSLALMQQLGALGFATPSPSGSTPER
jgi:steroid delta-isomerase-like uncharacterized protein